MGQKVERPIMLQKISGVEKNSKTMTADTMTKQTHSDNV